VALGMSWAVAWVRHSENFSFIFQQLFAANSPLVNFLAHVLRFSYEAVFRLLTCCSRKYKIARRSKSRKPNLYFSTRFLDFEYRYALIGKN
jgi:hypothetical protein